MHQLQPPLTGDSSVGSWLDHPVGGPILRDLLAQGGQNADVLRPVRKLALKRLVKLSKGRFPADLIDELVRRVAADIVPVQGDITDDAAIARIVAAAGDTIDGLANVAGIMDDMTPVAEMSDAVWKRVFSVNVDGTMKLMRAVIPAMLARATGSIVNVASEAALRGSAAGAAYTASKHAVVGLTKSSAFMYGPSGLRINAVAPGPVTTNIEAHFGSPLGARRVREGMAVMPDAVEADALAASITLLLSDDGVNIIGVTLASDGGWSAA